MRSPLTVPACGGLQPVVARLARSAARLTAAPFAIVAIRDHNQRWYKARHGFARSASHLEWAPDLALVASGQPVVASDLRDDARFAADPLVTSPAAPTTCAVVPVLGPGGAVLGAISVYDGRPHEFGAEDLDALADLAAQAAASLEHHRALDELVALREREQRYLQMLGQAHDEALRHLTDQLHEGISQDISGLSLLVTAAAHRASALDQALAGELREIATLLNDTIETCRLAAETHDGFVLAQLGLAGALERFVDGLELPRSQVCHVDTSQLENATLDDATAYQLLCIGQEAIRNAVEHSAGDSIAAKVANVGGAVVLTVEDNGERLLEHAGAVAGTGHAIMQFRARLIGAKLAVEAEPGRGYRVSCVVPSRQHALAAPSARDAACISGR